ncbi:MAG: class I SAM-dependent methyltransferase [Pseudomonadota bacterium]
MSAEPKPARAMGWSRSASAWVTEQGAEGDWSRRHILFPIFRAFFARHRGKTALDIGCGEGQLVRLARADGIEASGLDVTPALLERARNLDPQGCYREGRAEALPFANASFELVLSCVALVDIPDIDRAIPEMARVLRPGGRMLVANTGSQFSAGLPDGWRYDAAGQPQTFGIDHYLEPREIVSEWRGISVLNHHRPLSAYLQRFLAAGLVLRAFDEPAARSDRPEKDARHNRVPYFCVMEWERPA